MASPRLDTWIARLMAGGVAYYPSEEARNTCGIGLHERVRPLQPVRRTIDDTLRALREVADVGPLSEIEHQTTDGGEYAAIATLTATIKTDGQTVHYTFGFVFADDWYDRYDGWTIDPQRAEEVLGVIREAVRKHVLRLGLLRRRRFFYLPPPGWQALSRGLMTEWYPLDFPRHHAQITIPPAFPGNVMPSASTEVVMGRRMMNFTQTREATTEPLSLNGLIGGIARQFGSYNTPGNKVTHIVSVELREPKKHYTYLIRLETTEEWLEADQAVLFNMTKSVQAIPSMARGQAAQELAWVID